MREVKYQRPKGFVDPFAAPPETEPASNIRESRGSKAENDGLSPGKNSVASSSAHVHRVRSMRSSAGQSSHKSTAGLRAGGGVARTSRATGGNESSDAGSRERSTGARSHGHSRQHTEGPGDGGGVDHFEEDYDQYYEDGYEEEEEEEEEFKELLAEARRDIRISEEVAPHGKSAHHRGGSNHHHHHSHSAAGSSANSAAEVKLAVTAAMADIRCWLVNSEVIVISAAVHEEDRDLEAEAEISVEDLAVLRGEDPSMLGAVSRSVDDDGRDWEFPHQLEGGSVYSLAFDLPTLQQIAAEMVSHVELRVDLDSGARLILNLVSEEDPPSAAAAGPPSAPVAVNGLLASTTTTAVAAAVPGPSGGTSNVSNVQAHDVDSLVSEEELGNMLIDGKCSIYSSKSLSLNIPNVC